MNRKSFIKHMAIGTAALSQTSLKGASTTTPGAGAVPMSGLHDWGRVRQLFPLTQERLYLNTGGLGPTSRPVLQTMQEQLMRQAVEGEHFHEEMEGARQATAAFVGAAPEEI